MMPQPNNVANHVAGRRMIVAPSLEGNGVGLSKFLAVWLASTIINVSMLTLAFFVFLALGVVTAAPPDMQPDVQPTTEVEDREKDPDLTNTDIGLDSDVPLNYKVDRIEEVSVPGRVDPTAAVGIVHAP